MTTPTKFTAAQLVQLIDGKDTLRASQYFHLWLKQLFEQVGGPNAKSNTELTTLITQAQEDIVQLFDRADLTDEDINLIQITMANLAAALGLEIDNVGTVTVRLTFVEAVSVLGLWNHI